MKDIYFFFSYVLLNFFKELIMFFSNTFYYLGKINKLTKALFVIYSDNVVIITVIIKLHQSNETIFLFTLYSNNVY